MQINWRHIARPAISLTPLIDVVFILLLFFMLASDLHRINTLPLSTPANSKEISSSVSALLLRVHSDGNFSLVDERIDSHALTRRFRAYLDLDPGQAVIVQPDGDVTLQSLVDILDHLSALGATRLILAQR